MLGVFFWKINFFLRRSCNLGPTHRRFGPREKVLLHRIAIETASFSFRCFSIGDAKEIISEWCVEGHALNFVQNVKCVREEWMVCNTWVMYQKKVVACSECGAVRNKTKGRRSLCPPATEKTIKINRSKRKSELGLRLLDYSIYRAHAIREGRRSV